MKDAYGQPAALAAAVVGGGKLATDFFNSGASISSANSASENSFSGPDQLPEE